MSQEERTGQRDLSYNIWHRAMSFQRYMDMDYDAAKKLHYYDIDGAETFFYRGIGYPLFYIETAKYINNKHHDQGKRPMAALGAAHLSSHPPNFISKCYVVQYKTTGEISEFNASKKIVVEDIEELHVKEFFPNISEWLCLTPEEWAKEILRIREEQTEKLINYLRGK